MNFQTDLKYIDSNSVSCSGDNFSQSHPLIYLDLSSGKIVSCPYCSQSSRRKMISKVDELVLVDGSGYIFRAYYALPPMFRSDGVPVNAVFGFTNMLLKLIEEIQMEKGGMFPSLLYLMLGE